MKETSQSDAWGFNSKNRNLMIRWFVTTLCNYNCAYCLQNHSRYPKAVNLELHQTILKYWFSKTINIFQKPHNFPHAFDNYSYKKWLKGFERLDKNKKVALIITGGEPFLDKKNFKPLLAQLVSMNNFDNIRIDTNGSWPFRHYEGLDFSKIYLNVSFHPTQVSFEKFFTKIKEFKKNGVNVTMVNYVMAPAQLETYSFFREKFEQIGVKVNPNVFFGPNHVRTEKEMSLYKRYLNLFDIKYKSELEKPHGKKCRYPMIGYEMTANGIIHIGCHPDLSRNFIKAGLPKLFDEPVRCEQMECGCLDKYSFLCECARNNGTMNTLLAYVNDAIL